MSLKKDITGQIFGRLRAISPSITPGLRSSWKCYCDPECKWGTREEQAQNRRNNALTPELVKAIRRAYTNGTSRKELREQYSLAQTTLNNVINNLTWKNIE